MSHIIKPQGATVLRVVINMDAKGQIVYQCDAPGSKVPPPIHPLTLAQIFSTLAAQLVNQTVAAFQQGNKPTTDPGGKDDASDAPKIITN